MPKIMVLSDGETWSDIEGCQIIEVTNAEIVKAMSESTTPQGKTVGYFSDSGIFRVQEGIISVGVDL